MHSEFENLDVAIERINSDISRVSEWMSNHGLELNPNETQAILIGSRDQLTKINLSPVAKIRFNDQGINYSSSVKYLGYIFNEKFDSSDHVSELIKKVNFSLSKVNHCKRNIPLDAKLEIINGVIIPLFDYGSVIFHGHGITGTRADEKRIQVAHNKCIRYITRVNRFERISPIPNELNMLNMYNRRQFLILCFLHKLLDGESAPYLNDIFIRNKNNTRAGLDTNSLIVRGVKKNSDKLLLSHCLCNLWNGVPPEIRNSISHNISRTSLYRFILNNQRENVCKI